VATSHGGGSIDPPRSVDAKTMAATGAQVVTIAASLPGKRRSPAGQSETGTSVRTMPRSGPMVRASRGLGQVVGERASLRATSPTVPKRRS
jgi:hypothetical protein